MIQSQSAFNARHSESDNPAKWPSSWYKQYAEKFRIRHHKLPAGEKEIPKRTPEGMQTYLKLSTVHKRKRQVLFSNLAVFKSFFSCICGMQYEIALKKVCIDKFQLSRLVMSCVDI
jgi:hypothetical protein